MRYAPLAGVLLFMALAFVWRPWLQARRYGTSSFFLFRSRSRRQLAGDSLAIMWFALLLGQAAVAAAWPEWLARRALWTDPTGALGVIGIMLMVAGLALMVTAQLGLGASWRIGIEENASPGLVTHGLYGYSRNPIFLAFLIFMVGYVLPVPTVLSLALLVGTYFGIRRQISVEEQYLERTYGEPYRAYAARVGRFVPGIGQRR